VHGADLDRVHQLYVTGSDGETTLTLPDHVALLEKRIVAAREAGHPVGMVVIDPIGAFLSQGTDTHRDSSVRRALAPLAAMADTLDLVVVIVAHLTNDESRSVTPTPHEQAGFSARNGGGPDFRDLSPVEQLSIVVSE
jgi:hypothetical protein